MIPGKIASCKQMFGIDKMLTFATNSKLIFKGAPKAFGRFPRKQYCWSHFSI